jgi:hypothetical protein
MVVRTKLGWKKALEHAEQLVSDGELSREEHLRVIDKMTGSDHEQDQRIAVGLLKAFIDKYQADFDRDLSLDRLIEYGNDLCRENWNGFGRRVLYPMLEKRSVPAVWIDRIADEESVPLRKAFVEALHELAKRKRNPLERILGMMTYFLDEPDGGVRKRLAKAMKAVGMRDPERLHYFLAQYEEGAGTNRLALIAETKEKLGWKQ